MAELSISPQQAAQEEIIRDIERHPSLAPAYMNKILENIEGHVIDPVDNLPVFDTLAAWDLAGAIVNKSTVVSDHPRLAQKAFQLACKDAAENPNYAVQSAAFKLAGAIVENSSVVAKRPRLAREAFELACANAAENPNFGVQDAAFRLAGAIVKHSPLVAQHSGLAKAAFALAEKASGKHPDYTVRQSAAALMNCINDKRIQTAQTGRSFRQVARALLVPPAMLLLAFGGGKLGKTMTGSGGTLQNTQSPQPTQQISYRADSARQPVKKPAP